MPQHDPKREQALPDPGSFIGREPERVEETIPGGLSRRDERAAAVATRSGPTGPATDDTVREAGQDR